MEKTMLAAKYAEAVHETIRRIESTQMEAIDRAAELVARALAGGGAFWVYQLGHGGEPSVGERG